MARKVISITPFLNETHILNLRLGILEGVVDRFYTIEANETFTGLSKPMLANTVKHDKHVVVEIEFPYGLDEWGKENYQRDCATQFINLDEYNDDDIVLINDLDEIPNPDVIQYLIDEFDPEYTYAFDMVVHQYYLNNQNKGEGVWSKAKACSVGEYRKNNFIATQLRLSMDSIHIPNGGWHWTYIGGVDFIKNKIEAFAHSEFNNDYVKNGLEERLENNRDTLGRTFNLETVEIDTDFYPKYLRNNINKYSQYIKDINNNEDIIPR